MPELVLTEDRGAVRHLVLNRPEKRNAFNGDLIAALDRALRATAGDPAVHVVVIRGEGAVFSAGVDLNELMSLGADTRTLRSFRQDWLQANNRAEEIAKPVIAQIHGACFGGALELALACDLRVVAGDAKLGLPETRLGLIPDVGGSSRLPSIVGLGRAKELIMTSRTIDGDEAERIGLANRAVPPAELDAAVQALADELLACNPTAVGLSKRVMDAAAKPALSTTLELEVALQQACVDELARAAREAVGASDAQVAS